MERMPRIIEELKKINACYGLSNEKLEAGLSELADAKVCTPMIGKFSSGKSAVLNTLLGHSWKILKEDILPETAVPAEIIYEEFEMDCPVTIICHNGDTESCTLEEYRERSLEAGKVRSVRLHLNNHFMAAIKDVMLVDMPGFESGLDIHNQAIDNYLPESLAYMVAFPADDMTVRSSIGNILKELCLHDMPVCVVITKCDKVDKETLEANFKNLRKSLKRFIGDRDFDPCFTSSLEGEVKELKSFLLKIQEDSQEILQRKFKKPVEEALLITEQYLNALIRNGSLSESELAEKEEELQHQMEKLNKSVLSASNDFDKQLKACIDGIKADVFTALRSEESTFVAMTLNNQSINERVNIIVRSAVTESVQKRYIPIVEKYIDSVAESISVDTVTIMGTMMNIDMKSMEISMVGAIVAGVAAGVIIGFPVIGGILAAIIAGITRSLNEKKREEAKAQIRRKLDGEVFPNIVQQTGGSVEREILKQASEIKQTVNEKIVLQRQSLEKALADIITRQEDEQQKKDQLIVDVQKDQQKIEEMKHELRI